MVMGRKKQQEILAAVALGLVLGTGSMFLGAGMPVAQAASGRYTVTNKDETIDREIDYIGGTGGSNPTAVIFVPTSVSGGTITINSGSTNNDSGFGSGFYWGPSGSSSDFEISGRFTSTASDTGNTVNSSGIQLAYGYKGKVKIGDGTTLEVEGSGPRLKGSTVYSDQSGTGTDPTATSITLGNNDKISYEIDDSDTSDATVYGIYNAMGTLTAGKNLIVTMGNQSGKLAANGNLTTSGIFNRAGGVATIGDSLKLKSEFSSDGEITGTVSGIDSGKKKEPLNHFTLGNNADVTVYFTGEGKRNSNPDVLDENGNAFGIRALYLANSQFKIGNNNKMWAELQNDSTAATVAGTTIRSSNGTIGDEFSQTAWALYRTKVDLLRGLTVAEKSIVTAEKDFESTVTNNGFANQSDALSVISGSSLTAGSGVRVRNQEYGDDSSDQEQMATGVNASGNSLVKLEDDSLVQMDVRNKSIASIVAINLENSRMTMGKTARIRTYAMNNTYDANSQVYGVNVFKSSTNAAGDADIQIGEGSQILTVGNNAGSMVGLKNSVNGTASLGDGSTITVVQTSADPRDDENLKLENTQQGHSGNIAGYQGYQAKKTTFGKDVTISVGGNTDTANAMAYGSDNAYGELEAGDNLTVTLNTKGYANAFGLSTIGYNSAYPGTTAVGKGLHVTLTSDGAAYGIYNGNTKTGDATTIVEENPTVTVNANKAIGVSNIGSQGTVVLGDNATVTTDGTAASYGVLNQYGANTTFNGAATITSHKGSLLGNAATSYDEGSLIDITGPGRKLITGNLNTVGGGTIHLDMATGDSVLTGASTVNGGTTNISMSNGSLWNMTDNSAVTNLDLNSGAKVDMTYNPDGYHTLTIDNFSGNGGEFHMKSDLESQTDGDKVHITNAATGSSGQISVYDKSLATGNAMTGVHHLLMVTDASENATFSGKDLDTGGLWDIVPTVQRGGTFTDADGNVVGTANEWYLVQTAKKVNRDTQPLVAGVDGTYSLYRMSIDTLRQRLGDLRYRNRSEDKYDIWARNRAGRYAGSGYDSQYNFFQAGLDTMPNEKSAYGFLVERGIASPDYRTGNGKNHTLAGALYGTWLGDNGSYTDVVAKVGRDDTTIHTFGQYPDAANYRAHEQSLSVEYGRTIPRGQKGWFVEPQAQFVLGHLGSNDYTTRRGTQVREDSFNSAIGRLGVVLGKKQKEGKHPHDFYLKASVLHEFGGDRDYRLQRLNAAGDLEHLDGKYSYGDTWFELGLGGTVQVNKNTMFYADLERSFAGDYNKKWQVNAGLNWSF